MLFQTCMLLCRRHLSSHVMRPGDDVIGASRVHNSCDQLLVQVLPVVHPLSIINSETIDRALDWNIQQLQLLLKEGLLAPVSLFHNPDLVWNALLICARHPAAELELCLLTHVCRGPKQHMICKLR